MIETIFVEFNPIIHNEGTYSWISDLCTQYFQEVKDRGGSIKVVSETLNDYSTGFEYLMLEITEEDAYTKFKEREGKQRKIRVPVFDKKDLTKVVAYQTLVLDIKIYPEAPKDFEFKPREVSKRQIRDGWCIDADSTQLTHKPTGVIVNCKEERTKQDNEAMALRILKAKVYKNNDRKS